MSKDAPGQARDVEAEDSKGCLALPLRNLLIPRTARYAQSDEVRWSHRWTGRRGCAKGVDGPLLRRDRVRTNWPRPLAQSRASIVTENKSQRLRVRHGKCPY